MMKKLLISTLILFILLWQDNLEAQVNNIQSELVLIKVKSGKEKVILKENRHFEAPNWSRDGKYLVVNASGLLEKISKRGESLGMINTGFADQCNNDHGFSFDGKTLIISNGNSKIYHLPAAGGDPQLITPLSPSYWHGISPDGKDIVYTGLRNGAWDIFKMNIEEGSEIQLTTANGLDDGPEYSYDGQWIYFNAHRTGRMQLYRMRPDGSGTEQLTNDELDNWFPHPSPNNKYLVYISYLQNQDGQHPFGKDVKLRLMNVLNKSIKDLSPVFFGGQGSINVHSWSPNGKWVAFVRYRQL